MRKGKGEGCTFFHTKKKEVFDRKFKVTSNIICTWDQHYFSFFFLFQKKKMFTNKAPNSFMLFCKKRTHELKLEGQQITSNDLLKEWKELSTVGAHCFISLVFY